MSDVRLQVGYGHMIDPVDPNPDDIYIEDIILGLSNQCRFAGGLKEHYSVAEHSLRCSMIVPPEHAGAALLHDASEYVYVDIPRPIKNWLFGESYRAAEDRLMTVIADKFGFEWPMHPEVKRADNILLSTEHRDLQYPLPPELEEEYWEPWNREAPLPDVIVPMTTKQVMESFMIRYHVLFERS